MLFRSDYDLVDALESHKRALGRKKERLERLIRTVDDTIFYLQGKKDMSKKQLFEAFSDEQQEEYARQAEQMYDPEIVKASNRRWKAYSPVEKQRIFDEGNRIYTDMVAAMPKGAESAEVQEIVER